MFAIMSGKRKQWDDYKERQAKRRVGAKSDKASPSASEGFLTVQRLSANDQGKCQKYNRIGPLTLVPFDKEPTFKNIKDACKSHFGTNCECDVLAGERGPSYTHESQIKDWSKVIHIRFLEYEKSQKAEEPVFVWPLHKSEPVSPRKCDSAATAVITNPNSNFKAMSFQVKNGWKPTYTSNISIGSLVSLCFSHTSSSLKSFRGNFFHDCVNNITGHI